MDAQQAIERLYEDESLTSALEDSAAQPLMTWAERQLTRLAQAAPDEPRFEQDFAALRKLIKRIGRYIDRRGEWSEAEQTDELGVIKKEAGSISAPLTVTTPANYASLSALEVVAAMIGDRATAASTGVIATAKTEEPPVESQQQTDSAPAVSAKGEEAQSTQSVTEPAPDAAPTGGKPISATPETPETPPHKDNFLGDLIKRIFEE